MFDRKVRQIRDDVLDTGTDGPQQIGTLGELAFQAQQRHRVAGQFHVSRVAELLLK